MRHIFASVLATSLWAAPSGLYVEGGLGATFLSDTTYSNDTGYNGSLALGYQLDKVRIELEAIESKSEITSYINTLSYSASGDTTIQNKFLNLYYTAYNQTKLTSSFGIGIGVSDIELKDVKVIDSQLDDNSATDLLSYQLSYAIGYMASPNLTYSLKYRYIGIEDEKDEFIDSIDELNNQTLTIGVRYLF